MARPPTACHRSLTTETEHRWAGAVSKTTTAIAAASPRAHVATPAAWGRGAATGQHLPDRGQRHATPCPRRDAESCDPGDAWAARGRSLGASPAGSQPGGGVPPSRRRAVPSRMASTCRIAAKRRPGESVKESPSPISAPTPLLDQVASHNYAGGQNRWGDGRRHVPPSFPKMRSLNETQTRTDRHSRTTRAGRREQLVDDNAVRRQCVLEVPDGFAIRRNIRVPCNRRSAPVVPV